MLLEKGDYMENIRTRFAPSPTGYMHVGNLRSALYEYLIAKKYNGTFVLRIEDTDQKRFVEGAVDFIYKTLDTCNIQVDEGPNNDGGYGPYVQSMRLPLYKEYAEKLLEMGKAYCCFCDEERLEKLREKAEIDKIPFLYDGHCKNLSQDEIKEKIANGEKYVIRQQMPKEGTTNYDDLVYGLISIENKVLEDQILLKSDGYPTYNFANVIDDHLMKITHVVRGNEYLSSTPKYLQLYEAFGWEYPKYVHLPQVIKDDGKKLSKRNGDASFDDLYNAGYLPEAIINYLALLGWSPETNQEIFSMTDLINNFDISRIVKSPATYDIKKLQWINSHYIKKMDINKLLELTLPHIKEKYDITDKDSNWLESLVTLYKDQLSYGEEIVELVNMFFKGNIDLTEENSDVLKEASVENTLKVFKEQLRYLDEWTIDNISICINNTKDLTGVKGKMLYMPIRIKITGEMHGPELPATIYLIGKETVIKRLED
jgi:nondiscriminating glutamyl-tRNA synthetase